MGLPSPCPSVARLARAGAALLLAFALIAPVAGSPQEPAAATPPAMPAADAATPSSGIQDALCRMIDEAARAHEVPSAFLTRLIFQESSFRPGVTSPAGAQGVAKVSWFDTDKPLRSGWAVGQEKLNGSTAMLDIDLGKGKIFAFGPEITQRAQSWGTFKFLFNGLLYGPAAK